MPEIGRRAHAGSVTAEAGGDPAKKPRGRLALELVAMRGKDVLGVHHLLDGGKARLGPGGVPVRFTAGDGGREAVIGEVSGARFTVHVPPKARARMHGLDGIPRLLVGPVTLSLREGERAVLVMGASQLRAQVVTIEVLSGRLRSFAGAAGWIAFVGAVYAAVFAVCAALGPDSPARLERGAMRHIHGRFLPDATAQRR